MTKNYTDEINKYPLLSAKREIELAKIIQDSDNQVEIDDAITELFQSNLRLVAKEANKYCNKYYNIDFEELYNNGRMGLLKATYDYNPEKYNTRFSTYAFLWIKKYVRDVVYGNSPVKIPSNVINAAYRKNKILEFNSKKTKSEIQKELGVTDSQMKHIDMARISSISLNQQINESESDETFSSVIMDENADIPGEIKRVDPRYDFMEESLNELDDMSRDIVTMQILMEDKVKLSDIGIKYGITGERVRQIRQKALKKLRKKIECKMAKE